MIALAHIDEVISDAAIEGRRLDVEALLAREGHVVETKHCFHQPSHLGAGPCSRACAGEHKRMLPCLSWEVVDRNGRIVHAGGMGRVGIWLNWEVPW